MVQSALSFIGSKATGTLPSFVKLMRSKGHNMKTLNK